MHIDFFLFNFLSLFNVFVYMPEYIYVCHVPQRPERASEPLELIQNYSYRWLGAT